MNIHEEIKKLQEDCLHRFDSLDEMMRMLLVTNASVLIDEKSRGNENIKSGATSQEKPNSTFGFSDKKCANKNAILQFLPNLGFKLVSTSSLYGINYIVIDTKSNPPIASIRKVQGFINNTFKNFYPLFVVEKVSTTTRNLMIQEGYSFIVKNKEINIISGRR